MGNRRWLFAVVLLAALCAPLEARMAVFVGIAPPRPVVERVVPAPAPRLVWVSDYYRWNGRAYIWTPGRWVYPPRPSAVWVAPRFGR